MTEELTFSSADISALAAKVDGVTTGFDERERALLLAVFALAKEALDARAESEVEGFGFVVTKPFDIASPKIYADAASKDPAPQESLSLNFTKVMFTYTE